jgi:hypothetical protein
LYSYRSAFKTLLANLGVVMIIASLLLSDGFHPQASSFEESDK